MDSNTPLKVLYIHGIDGSPKGIKSHWLKKAGFNVLTPDMSQAIKFTKSKSNPTVLSIIAMVCSAAGLDITIFYYFWKNDSVVYGALFAGLIAFIAARIAFSMVQGAVRKLHNTCLTTQQTAIAEFKPDIVVGSSWGGSILIELINKGLWAGPTLLLAPAQQTVAKKAGLPTPTITKKLNCAVHLYHGTGDTTIPYSESVALKQSSKSEIHFVSCPEDDHMLSKTIHRDNFKNFIMEVYNSSH